MKVKSLITAAMFACAASSNGAIYYVSNLVSGTGASDALYQDVDDSLLNNTIVALGYFPTNVYVPSTSLGDIATTIADFTTVASALTGSGSSQLSGPGAPGYVDAAAVDTASITASSALFGRPLYVFAGNAATLGASTAWALKQVGTLLDDESAENEYFANPIGGAAPSIGSVGSFTGAPIPSVDPNSSTFSTLKLVAVPEPSVALITALGALGFLRRRR